MNFKIHKLEQNIINLINESNLPVYIVYLIIRTIYKELEDLSINALMQEASQQSPITTEQTIILDNNNIKEEEDEELEQEGSPSNNSESFEETRTIYYNDEKQQLEDIEGKKEESENGTL